MSCNEHPRDSHLTFAVVWDPERGLEAYSGCELMCLRSVPAEGYDFPESIYSASQADDEGMVSCNADEPLSVSGRHKAHFIDEQYTRGLQSSSKANTTTTTSFSLSQIEKSLHPPSVSSSKWTFAALWDPMTGLSAFSQGKLSKFIPLTKHHKWPSASTTTTTTTTTPHHSHGYIDNIKHGFYLRVLPEIGSHSTALSSPVEGHQHEPRFSCFDPLNECLLFEPLLHPFPQFSSTKGNHPPGANDGYVMISDNLNHTNLPSRFSTSTTSTSGYVPIHPTSVHATPPITFLGSRATADSRSPRKTRRLLRSKSACLRHEGGGFTFPFPRLFRFRNAPWSKGEEEEDKWVFVEIRSVVTDRVVHEL